MLWTFFTRLAAATILVADSTPGPPRMWIADIKSNREQLAGQDVRLEGEVVDLRSTSPTAKRGFYRLSDASDPAGVLVRTESLPMEGGNFRLVGRVAAEQMVEGALLVDEVERRRTDGRPVLPMVAAVLSALVLTILMVLLRRAMREEREYLVAPPLWLLPDSGPYGKALPAPSTSQVALKYQPELEEADRHHRVLLRRRKRSLVQAVFGSLALTGSSAAWVIDTRPISGQVPAFIFIDANDPAARANRGLRAQLDSSAPVLSDSALLLALEARPMPAPARAAPPDTLARLSSAAISPAESAMTATARDSGPPTGAGTTDTAALAPATAAPAPPPPTAAPERREPERDPGVERSRASDAVSSAASRLVGAINARRIDELALLLPEAIAGDLSRRERFFKLVREFSPRATLGPLSEVAMRDDRGEASFSITLAWRGDFGVDHRKSGRLLGGARRQNAAWVFDGARLLDALP